MVAMSASLSSAQTIDLKFELDEGRMSVADGDEQIDEFHDQLVCLAIMQYAPVEVFPSPDNPRLAKREQAGQTKPDVTVSHQNVLTIKCKLHAHLAGFQVSEGTV